jgi:hypothetical protein
MKLYSALLKFLIFLLTPFTLAPVLLGWLRYRVQMIEAYQPRPDDIFIVTFPRSGTTVLQMMLYQLTTDGSMNIPHILSVSPWFERELILDPRARETFEALPSPRVFKTHLSYEKMPKNGRFIYISRDIRDVVISSFHHYCLTTGRDHNLQPFVDRFIRDNSAAHSWYKNLESWWPHRTDENVLFLTYAEIVRDIEGTARKVAAFCGIAIDESSMPRIVECCSLGFMKQHWDKFDPRLRRVSRTQVEFVRKGVAGAGRHELSPTQEELVSSRLKELAAKLGCTPGEPHSELFT